MVNATPPAGLGETGQTTNYKPLRVLAADAPASTNAPQTVERAFPWLASMLLHVGAAMLAVFLYNVVRSVAARKPRPLIIPASLNAPFEKASGGVPHVGRGDPLKTARQDVKKLFRATGWHSAASPASISRLLSRAGSKSPLSDTIGVGSTAGGVGMGQLSGGGGAPAPFGMSGGGDGPFKGMYKTGGHLGNAKRIVYVIDRSGFMVDYFADVRRELVRSIDGLTPIQKFAVIVFSNKSRFIGPSRLVRADAASRGAVRRLMAGVNPEGGSQFPFRAYLNPMKKAFALHPEEIFFLTDGRFDPRLVGAIANLNRARKVKIVVFACVGLNEARALREEKAGKTVYLKGRNGNSFTLQTIVQNLSKIAKENGGRFRVLYRRDMERRGR